MKEKTKCSDKKSLNKYFYISQNFLSVEGDAFNEAHPAKERHGILFFFSEAWLQITPVLRSSLRNRGISTHHAWIMGIVCNLLDIYYSHQLYAFFNHFSC